MRKLSLFSCLLLALLTQSLWAQNTLGKSAVFKKSTSAAIVPGINAPKEETKTTTPPPPPTPAPPPPTPTPPPVVGNAGAGDSTVCKKYALKPMHIPVYKECLKCINDKKGTWKGNRCSVQDHRTEENPVCKKYSPVDPRKKLCNKCYANKGTWDGKRCSVRDHR